MTYIETKQNRIKIEEKLETAKLAEAEALVTLLNKEYPTKIEFIFHRGSIKFLYNGFILRNKKCSLCLSFPSTPEIINYLAISDYDSPLLQSLRESWLSYSPLSAGNKEEHS